MELSTTKILIIDDKQDNLTSVCALLKHSMPECTLITAQSGAEGIDKVLSEHPDVILLDVKMPGMDGYEVCRRLKNKEATQAIPIIMLTAAMRDMEKQLHGYEAGADAYLTKPIEPAILYAQLKIALRVKRAEDKLRKDNVLLSKAVAETQNELHTTETLLQSLVENSTDHIFMLSKQGDYLWSNDRVEFFQQDNAKRIIGKHVNTVYPPDVADLYHRNMTRVVEFRNSITFDYTLLHSREARYYRATLYPIWHDGIIEDIGGICSDTTDRKKLELQEVEAQRRISSLMANLPGMAYRCKNDRNWTMTFVSDGTSDLIGYTAHEVSGNRLIAYGDIIAHEDRQFVWNEVQSALSQKKSYEVNYRIVTKNGTIKWVLEKGNGIFSDDGQVMYIEGFISDITKLKAAEQNLADNKAQLELLIRSGNIGLWDWDLRTNKVYYSPEYKYQIGYTENEISDEFIEWQSRVHPDDLDRCLKAVQAFITGKASHYNLEYRFRHKDNSYRWILVQASRLVDEKGQPIRMIGSHIDITQQKKTEQVLRESENRFRLLYENIPQAYQCLNEDDVLVEVNKSWLQQFGYTQDEVIGKSFADFLHPDWVGHFKTNFPQFKSMGEVLGVEFELRKKDNSYVCVSIDCKIEHGLDGSFLQTHCVLTDIGERKRSENAIREAHELMLTVLDGFDSHVLVVDPNTHEVLFANLALRNTFQHNVQGKICWKALRDQSGPCNKQCDLGLADLHGMSTGSVLCEEHDQNAGKWYLHADRAIKWIDNRMVKLRLTTDITESKRQESQRILLEKKLLQAHKMESIGTLAGGIAHDFNNILSVIMGFTELALVDAEKGTDIEENMQQVYVAGIRARDLVRQILAFARQTEEVLEPIQLSEIAKEVLTFLRASLPTSITISSNIQSDSMIIGNATHVHQIIMNLCTNAAHAMEDDGGVLSVSISNVVLEKSHDELLLTLEPGRYVCITIADTGTGMAPEILNTIFEPYFTTKETGKGTGMGLALVHGIVESYSGAIKVDSALGKGSTFSIYLPIFETDESVFVSNRETHPKGSERVLFVDDEEAVARMGTKTLQRLGYEVTMRTSSVEALALFSEKPNAFDVVITDMTMPNMNGDKLAIALMGIRPDIPVIMCTGYSNKISEDIATRLGIKAFIYKPVVMMDLANTLRQVLDESKIMVSG